MTLRQLLWMAEGHCREIRGQWAQTSLICALIANAHRDPRKHRPFKAADFDPYARREPVAAAAPSDLRPLREALQAARK